MRSYLELPQDLLSKTKVLVNLQHKNHKCLRLAITPALHPDQDHATRKNNYVKYLICEWEPHETEIDYIIMTPIM